MCIRDSGAASAKLSYSNKAFIYKIGPLTINIFLIIGIIILIVSYVFLFKTKWGLRLRACGEHPQAADSVGINVYQWRYTGVMISGALGGIGGFAYIVPVSYTHLDVYKRQASSSSDSGLFIIWMLNGITRIPTWVPTV